MAYLLPEVAGERPHHYKSWICSVQVALLAQERIPQLLWVQKHLPNVRRDRVCVILHDSPVPDAIKISWYRVINDIIPIRVRLATIHLAASSDCESCGREDTVDHRLTECGNAPLVWNITRRKIGHMLPPDTRHIPRSWILQPDFHHWPEQK
jgi:hypothetical protein